MQKKRFSIFVNSHPPDGVPRVPWSNMGVGKDLQQEEEENAVPLTEFIF